MFKHQGATMGRNICAILALFLFSNTTLASSFVCVVEGAGGIVYDKRTENWRGASLSVETEHYVVAPSSSEGFSYEVKKTGEQVSEYTCAQDFNSFGFLRCGSMFGTFLMNSKTLRFQTYYPLGYVVSEIPEDQSGNTPSISFGKCSELDLVE